MAKEKLIWLGKSVARRSDCLSDVSVTSRFYEKRITASGEKEMVLEASLTFRNDTEQIVASTGYVRFAMIGNRLYFQECASRDGYKVRHQSSRNINGETVPSSNAYCTVSNHTVATFLHNREGNYVLKYDFDYDCYYIDTKENV